MLVILENLWFCFFSCSIEAELEYLKIAQDLDMYGISYFQIRVSIYLFIAECFYFISWVLQLLQSLVGRVCHLLRHGVIANCRQILLVRMCQLYGSCSAVSWFARPIFVSLQDMGLQDMGLYPRAGSGIMCPADTFLAGSPYRHSFLINLFW